ncbi:MAG: hypothetical protein VX527_02120 [Planctomycetota bacterium]|nr:hypothetical protein [Planctomycetota bacterium]
MPHQTPVISRITLCTTAIVLFALVLFQVGGHGPTLVQADMVTEGGGYTMLTMSGRNGAVNNEVQSLVILDNAAGWLLIYELTGGQTNRTIELLDGGALTRLFDHGQSPPSRVPRP